MQNEPLRPLHQHLGVTLNANDSVEGAEDGFSKLRIPLENSNYVPVSQLTLSPLTLSEGLDQIRTH